METYKGEAIHGRPSLEGHIFLYQVSPTKYVLLSKCINGGMFSLWLPNKLKGTSLSNEHHCDVIKLQ